MVEANLRWPTYACRVQQRSSKILNTFRPMAIQDHRPSIRSSVDASVKRKRKIANGKRIEEKEREKEREREGEMYLRN